MPKILDDLIGSVFLWLVIVLAVGVYAPLLEGSRWWVVGGLVVAVVLLISRLLDLIRIPAAVQPLVMMWLWFFWMMLIFATGTGVPGLVPTSATVEEISVLVDSAQRVILERQPPVPVGEGLTFILVGSISLFTLAADVLDSRLRSPMAVGVVVASIMVVPGLVLEELPDAGLVVAVVFAWVLLLYHRSGPHTWGRLGALTVTAPVAIGGMLLAVLVLPTPDRQVFDPTALGGPSFDGAVSPLISLSDDLRRPSPYPALTYTSDGPQYTRMLTITDFEGSTWGPDEPDSDAEAIGGSQRLPRVDSEDRTFWGREVTTRIRIEEVESSYLPLPYPPTAVTGLSGEWQWDRRDGSAFTDDGSTEDEVYAVTSQPLELEDGNIRPRPGVNEPVDARASQIPDELPAVVEREARNAVSGARDDLERGIALEDYFRSGDFTYSEETPADEGYDGDGIDILEPFFDVRAGYCVHYATAMATMARAEGIPARIAVGFLPGRLTERDGDRETYAVTSDQFHAWPELYIEGVGWVGFEPTPGRGETVGDPGPTPSPEPPSPSPTPDGPSPSPSPETPTPDTPSPEPTDDADAGPVTDDDVGSSGPFGLGWIPVLGGVSAVALLLGLVPALVRILRRRRRLAGAAGELWDEVLDTARDLGVVFEAHRTPRVIASQLQAAGVDEGDMGRLRQAWEIDHFAPPEREAKAYRSAAVGAIRSLREVSTPGQRIRAIFFPRTLF